MRTVRGYLSNLTENYGLTIILSLSFVLIYELQLIVFNIFPKWVFVWLFTFDSIYSPSAGWVLSSFAHGSVLHLAANTGMLLLAGGFSEPHLKRREYITFFTVVGTFSTFLNIAIWPSDAPTLGASASVLGFVGYSMYHYAQRHPDALLPTKNSTDGVLREQQEVLKSGYVILGFPFILLWLLLPFAGVIDTGDAADGSHLFGFLLGALYVYWQPVLSEISCD